MRRAIQVASIPLALAACFSQPHGAAKVQEVATELNVNTRFGRMEMAAEQVAPKEREEFLRHRTGWGGRIRVADAEIIGLSMKGDDDADVTLRVAWFRPDEGELRITMVKQAWHDFKGDWKLTGE